MPDSRSVLPAPKLLDLIGIPLCEAVPKVPMISVTRIVARVQTPVGLGSARFSTGTAAGQ
jgi:hypothetical protein